ncbi:MAG: ABC transporter permease [Thermoplasmata archaeon]|nr:ABC transporter permease [Thermoplasmata archaeon]
MAARTETAGALTPKRRPNPQLAQALRTFYFLRKNTLAMVGLGILIALIFVAVYSFFNPTSNSQLEVYCGSYTGNGGAAGSLAGACTPVCTYANNVPPPMPNCYPVDPANPSILGPTFSFTNFQSGPLPLGALTVLPDGNYFFSIYQGLVKGAPWSLGISAGIVVSGAMIGLGLGAVAGYKGGLVDELIMRITDIFLSIPSLLFVLVVLAVFASNTAFSGLTGRVMLLMGAFILVWWPFYTRLVRGQVLVVREQKYVEAARASGAKTGRIVLKHIIPNSLYPMFVQMSLDVGAIPLLVGGLVFLGFHVFPSEYFPEWGSISAIAVRVIPNLIVLCQVAAAGGNSCTFPWWQVLFPGLIVFMFAISVNFLSDGLRDALDPRLRR